MLVNPQYPVTLQQAGVLTITAERPTDVLAERFGRGVGELRGGRISGVTLAVAGGEGSEGLNRALIGAYRYIRDTTELQNEELGRLLAGADPESGSARIAQLVLDTSDERFAATYVITPASESGGALRGAMLGLLFGGLALAGSALGAPPARRRAPGIIPPSIAPPWPWLVRHPVRTTIVAALGAAAVSALAGFGPELTYTLLTGLTFGAMGLAFALRGEREVRLLLAAVVLITPFRGAVLASLEAIGAPGATLIVNAIQPALVLSAALGVLALGRTRVRPMPAILAAGVMVIAAVCAVNVLTQTVGLTVFAIGAAQYLTYPVFALALWQVLGPDGGRLAARALIWLGLAVSLTVAIEAVGLVSFEQSLSGEGLETARYGGATGSFLHASIFIGTTIPILAGWLLGQHSRAGALAGALGLSVLIGGLALTFGRAGIGIAAIGVLLLFLASPWRTRFRMLAVGVVALAIALPISWAAGRAPDKLFDRVVAVVDPDDSGNRARIRGQKAAFNNWRDSSLAEHVLGDGLASTGNARRLASLGSQSPESFMLKLLVETGIVGLLTIGAILIWTAILFLRVCFSAAPPLVKGVGAAGFGLFVDGFFYQTLEVQLIAMTWWLLLVIALRQLTVARP